MNPYGDIDLTRYLQTEGRRRAAALAKAARERNAPSASVAAAVQQQQCAGAPTAGQAQQQAEVPGQQRPASRQPSSLTEVLAQMGVTKPR